MLVFGTVASKLKRLEVFLGSLLKLVVPSYSGFLFTLGFTFPGFAKKTSSSKKHESNNMPNLLNYVTPSHNLDTVKEY